MPDWFSFYSIAWAGWILYFIIVEGHALLFSDDGTLSAHSWAIFGIGRDSEGNVVISWRRIIALVALLILTSHLAFGIP